MKVRFDELLYVESLDDYIKMHMAGGEELVSKERISHMELTLPDSFVRIHRSFIVNQEKISSFTREHVVAGGKELPISRTYKQEVVSRLSISQSL